MQLSVIATPIGNLGDLTHRAVATLQSVQLLLCEDTRHTRRLLQHYGLEVPLAPFHARTSQGQLAALVRRCAGLSHIGYVTDAGTPGISDPGFRLLQAFLGAGAQIVTVPGPSALTACLAVAGIPVNRFRFEGFLPHKKGRQTLLQSLTDSDITVAFYESVHRFPRLLQELPQHLPPERIVVVGRELTKLHEEVFRGPVSALADHFTPDRIRGEFVILIAPRRFSLPPQS